MSRDKRVPLRAEEASSWEEFLARFSAERTFEIRRAEPPTKWLWMLAAVGIGLIDAGLWGVVAQAPSPGRWIAVPFAVLFIFPIIFCLAMGPQWGLPITDRTRELDVVWQEMKARTDRGEIPLTTPGGPKVWQEQ